MATRFGRYWLQEKIGHGGMAEVFRATIGPDAHSFAFELAIKRLHADLEKDPKQVSAFLTEADVAKFLRHPNLVQVYEAGIVEGRAYIAMEYIWGFDLARLVDILRRRRLVLPPELALYITLQILRALDYVHQAKNARGNAMDIVHRDVTPSNIYVTFRGEVKLGDFGIARIKSDDEAGILQGKVHYMPPEVIGGAPVSAAVDLWSLSVTLYEMLTARPLHEGVPEAEMLAGNYSTKIEPVHKINHAVEPELSAILARALHPKTKKRPPDAATLYRELKQFVSERGLQADAPALARFLRAGANVTITEPKAQAGSADFANPEYLAPIEFSPTQRYEMKRRRRTWQRGWLLGLPVVAALAGALSYTFIVKHRRAASAPNVIDNALVESELVGDLDADTQQRFHALLRRGALQIKRGSLEVARTAFRQALEIRPRSTAAQLGLARVAFEQADYTAAEQLVTQVIKNEPKNARAKYMLGSILRARGQVPQARQAFSECQTLDPEGQFGKSAQQILSSW